MLTIEEQEIVYSALNILNDHYKPGKKLSDPAITGAFLQLRLNNLAHEVFEILWLDTQHRIIDIEMVASGTINQAAIYPREVVKSALKHNASACILAHNHPSGDVTESNADMVLTNRLKASLALIDVRVLDHFIVGGSGYLSFVLKGLL